MKDEKQQELVYQDLITKSPRSRNIDSAIESHLLDYFSDDADKTPYRKARLEDLRPFLEASGEFVRQKVLLLLSESSLISPTWKPEIKVIYETDKSGDVRAAACQCISKYSDEVDYLIEQSFCQRKPAAKCAAFWAVEKQLGEGGLEYYLEALAGKRKFSLDTFTIAFDAVEKFGGEGIGIEEVISFVSRYLSARWNKWPPNPLTSGLAYLYNNTLDDSHLVAFNEVKDAWSYPGSIGDKDQWYLKRQYEYFSDLPLRTSPPDWGKELTDKALTQTGIPKRANLRK